VDLLDKYNDKETPLNIQKYREKLTEIKATSKQLEDLTKLTIDLSVKNIATDSLELSNDKDKLAKNKQFLKRISDDIYVDETMKVVDKMIGEAELAQRR
jgi:carboxyl-terminal processing protease